MSFPTYYYFWLRNYPNLKVRTQAEYICTFCWQFANRQKYRLNTTSLFKIAQGTSGGGGTGEQSDGDSGQDESAGNDNGRIESVSNSIGGDNSGGDPLSEQISQEKDKEESGEGGDGEEVSAIDSTQLTVMEAGNVDVNEMEHMLLRAALHVKRADTQREGYKLAEQQCKTDKLNTLPHSETTYRFVVDFGQNMECPS